MPTLTTTGSAVGSAALLAPYVTWGVQYHFAWDKAPSGWDVAVAGALIFLGHAVYTFVRYKWFPQLPEKPPFLAAADQPHQP